MSRVRRADTKPEMIVRRLIHGMGYRYRLHDSGLPGQPDLVFKGKRKAIFVHGCFWHQHRCHTYRMPKTRVEFWGPKLKGNVERDRRARGLLRKAGWDILVIWECELRKADKLRERIRSFLEPAR
jgi:DNA mismatch endonuclease, patch repair protein